MPSTSSTRRTRRISSPGSATASCSPTCRRTWRSSIPPSTRMPDGLFASFRVGMSVIGYNTNLVKAEDAPKSFADLLDPKWSGKMVKAHPGYSGNVMSATFQLTRDLGWEYLEKLAKQKIMQVQSSTDPPKKLALGERAVMVDGNEYNALQLKEAGQPIEIVYPTEGTPMAVGPNAIFKNAPNPNAARLLQQLHVHAGMPAARHRRRRAALGPSEREGEAGPQAVQGHQGDEGRCGGRREERGRTSGRATARYSACDPQARKARNESSNENDIQPARRAQGGNRADRNDAVRRADPRRRAAGRGGDARADRGGEERRQGHPLHLGRSAAGGEGRRRRSRRNIPASRSASSAPAPSACSPASPRSGRATSTPATWCSRRTPRISWSGSAKECSRPTCPRTSPSTIRPSTRTPDGLFASYRVYLCVMARNTDLVKAEDAPKGYRDLLDPKWAGKIVKAHPGYSGTILTATYQTARDVGWDYYEKLAKQRVMQVQSASDPPKKLALGERAIMADGIEYGVFQLKETGKPVDVIYPVEGSPLIIGPNGILKSAPNPNAARLLQSFMLSAECQQFNVDFGGLRIGPRAGQGQARPHADEGHQGHEGRRGRGRKRKRADQGPLRAVLQGLRPAMRKQAFAARRVEGLRRAGARAFLDHEGAGGGAAGVRGHAGADRGGEEGRQGRLLHLDRPAARREDRQGVRGEISRHRRARRAHRRRARVPAHRPGIREPHLRRRCGELVRRRALHRLEARRPAGALRAGGRRAALSGRAQGRRWPVRELPRRA